MTQWGVVGVRLPVAGSAAQQPPFLGLSASPTAPQGRGWGAGLVDTMTGRCRSGVAAALTVRRNREKIAGGKRDWRGVGAVLIRVLGTIEARSGLEDD